MTDNTRTEALLPSRETLMAQAQVFASAWAIAGSSFDTGDGMEVAEQEKAILADMTRRLHARIAGLEAQIEALSGVQALSAAPAVPAGWKAVPVNPTPEMWKAAKSVPDPNPPYPPHYGLVWDAMLAASPTPPAEQAAPKAAPGVVNSVFDHQTAADFLSGKTVSDEDVRKFVAASRWAHDERAALSATLLAMHGVLTSREAEIALLKKALLEAEAAPQQKAQEPCPTCVALARTVMLDQVSFDRKPDCYGIRQITDDEGVEEWEDIRTSPDVAREEANDMMATGRGEIYEVVPLWTTPQPAPATQQAHQQEAQEPAAWQSRTRPTWGGNTRPWSPWEPCTKGQAEDCWKTPLLHDWAYEARALFTAPQPAPATQKAHQQEAQELVAVVVPCHTPSGKRVALYSAKQDLPIGTQLYTAPQPSPTTRPAPQPAPAPLSESEYKRGYRDGYEHRDAEVRGALA